MQNGFEKHGIEHTSPSSLNTFAAAPDVWVCEKLFGKRGRIGAPAFRGILVEKAVVNVIAYGASAEDAIDESVKNFNKEMLFSSSDKIIKEREAIAPCVEMALQELKPYGTPEFQTLNKQDKIELMCNGDGWKLPIIGYTDLPFPKYGLIVDLKTTLKVPSEMSAPHRRQAAVYQKASGNMAVKFLYVTPKKAVWHVCEDVDATLGEVKQILNRQERFLRLGDKELLRDVVHFDPTSFYWNGNEQSRQEVYGA